MGMAVPTRGAPTSGEALTRKGRATITNAMEKCIATERCETRRLKNLIECSASHAYIYAFPYFVGHQSE